MSQEMKLWSAYFGTHGMLPKSCEVIPINGDYKDLRPENLVGVPRKIVPMLRKPLSSWAKNRHTVLLTIRELAQYLNRD